MHRQFLSLVFHSLIFQCIYTAQTSVMRAGTSRDGRQQSRLLRGTKDGFEICTIDHQKNGQIRVDATIAYQDDSHEVGVYAHEDEAYDHDNYFKVYQPQFNDHGYVCADEDDEDLCLLTPEPITEDTVAWWKLSCGRVLGVVNGMMLEFDKSTLAPLGLVVSGDMLLGKQVAIVDSGLEECMINFEEDGMDGADCADGNDTTDDSREQVSIHTNFVCLQLWALVFVYLLLHVYHFLLSFLSLTITIGCPCIRRCWCHRRTT